MLAQVHLRTLLVPMCRASRFCLAAAAWWLASVTPACGDEALDLGGLAHTFFPAAERVGEPEGTPRAAPVFDRDQLLGYLFLTDEVTALPGYSGKPIGAAVGIDLQGVIRGVRIVRHEEPILVIGVTERDLQDYVQQYGGRSALDRVRVGGEPRQGYVTIDGISGATITVMVLNASIMRAARSVAQSRGLPSPRMNESPAHATATPATRLGAAAAEPLWVEVWRQRARRIAVLGVGLVLLTTVLVLQDWVARHPTLLVYLRIGFLVYTVTFIGWYALAQLSIVNVLTFTNAIVHQFRWETFLIEPSLFILWSFVAVTLLLWGRGVYCGWLCPYGALQELVNKAATWLKVPQLTIPSVVHERLLAIKYAVLLALFGLSLQSMADAVRFSEVEPFKTAFSLRFDREWPFVAYALGLVAVSALNGKLFCKYLCPLGAALTIPAHFRIFDYWLRRRRECGRPCQTCAKECPSQAIRPTGEIDANECHYCLDCQVTYWNAYKCPPLVEKRKRSERRRRGGDGAGSRT